MAFLTLGRSCRLARTTKPVRPASATKSVRFLILAGLAAWLFATGQAALLCVWLRSGCRFNLGEGRTETPNGSQDAHQGESFSRLLDVPLVELRVLEGMPWRVAKVLAPLLPEVAQWWTEADAAGFSASIEQRKNRGVRVRVEIAGGEPLRLNGGAGVRAVHSALDLPEDAVIEDCRVSPVQVDADLEPLASLGQIRALLVVCPVRGGNKAADALYAYRGPLKLLALPVWLLLLLPLVLNSSAGSLSMLGGACLMMASMVCFSLVLTMVAVALQRQCTAFVHRWKRLLRLRTLDKRPSSVEAVFGATGPCCICLEEPEDCKLEELKRIVLLPCRHVLHRECYIRWVCADAYPSEDLICPMCRGNAEAIGQLVP